MIKKEEIIQKLTINPENKKCFIFDLDGTIVFQNVMLGQSNKDILHKIIDHGHEVIFATGRSYRDFKAVMPSVFHNHKATLFSGSLSRDVDGTILRGIHVPKSCVEDIVTLCLDHKSPFIIDNISHYYHPPMDDTFLGIIDSQISNFRVKDIDKMLETDIYKVLVFDMQLHSMFIDYAKDKGLVTKHHSYDSLFDIAVAGCDKYEGVLPLLGNFSNEDIFVFGNDFNDYEMLYHFQNSVVFGSIDQLIKISKLNIGYDEYLEDNFRQVIDTILGY